MELLDSSLDPATARERSLVRYLVVCPALLALLGFTFAPAFRRWMQPAVATAVVVAGLGLVAMFSVSSPEVARNVHRGLIHGLLFVYILARLRFPWAAAVAWTITAAAVGAAAWVRSDPTRQAVGDAVFLGSTNVIGMLAAWTLERHERNEFAQRREIQAERQRSDRLLRNVLPQAIAERLKRGETAPADDVSDATVLFADLVGFTPLAERLPAERVVALLDDVFSRWDAVAAELGLEKIKTIGDAYLLAAGVPLPRTDHASAVAEAALRMRAAAALVRSPDGEPLQVRIGIHTGPLVAGVIGRSRLGYDLWGDTVNTASRLEAQGSPGRIQVSGETRARLVREGWLLEPRGALELKGKGLVEVFWLLGRAAREPAPAAGP